MKAISLALIACLLPSLACARESLVGEWAPSAEECGTPSAIKLGARSLASDETMCDFPSVSRDGDVVTFVGKCDSGQGPAAETLVARLKEGRLSLEFGRANGRIAGLLRCPRP